MRNLKPLVNTPLYLEFLGFLEDRTQELYKALATQTRDSEMHRVQGALREINRLKKLKEQVNGQ